MPHVVHPCGIEVIGAHHILPSCGCEDMHLALRVIHNVKYLADRCVPAWPSTTPYSNTR